MSNRTGVALIIVATLIAAAPFAFGIYAFSGIRSLAGFGLAVLVLIVSAGAVTAAVARRSQGD